MRRAGHHDALVRRRGRERVDEVEVGTVGHAVEQRVRTNGIDRIPADVRERWRVHEAHRSAGEEPQSFGIGLIAGIEEELEAEADAQTGTAVSDPFAEWLRETAFAKVDHSRSSRADTRDDDRVHAHHSRRIFGHGHVGPDRGQGLGDADHVRGAVVENRDLDRAAHPSAPLVEAGPCRRGSTVTAADSARPSALKAASARW